MNIVMSFSALCLLLILGKIVRVKVPVIQKLYLPTSVVAGLIGLVILSTVGDRLADGWTAGWTRLPGFLINIVFAALFLGVEIPPLREIWRRSGVQLAYGQIVAWGQYLVGVGLVLVLLGPLFGVPHIFGVIVPVGFEGGHGTAGGLRPTFESLGWREGSDFGLASATAGIVSAIIIGFALINWAARKGYVKNLRDSTSMTPEEQAGFYPIGQRPSAGKQTTSPDSVESLALHLAIIGMAVLIGYGLKMALVAVENRIPAMASLGIFAGFPLFPLSMLGGLIIQSVANRTTKHSP
ncbi:MAG: sodium:glutamate symporter, partial [Chitinivibrionales bacterium]|nr:sodium:glutamate symporter [Chitinivibrionales bacterium]